MQVRVERFLRREYFAIVDRRKIFWQFFIDLFLLNLTRTFLFLIFKLDDTDIALIHDLWLLDRFVIVIVIECGDRQWRLQLYVLHEIWKDMCARLWLDWPLVENVHISATLQLTRILTLRGLICACLAQVSRLLHLISTSLEPRTIIPLASSAVAGWFAQRLFWSGPLNFVQINRLQSLLHHLGLESRRSDLMRLGLEPHLHRPPFNSRWDWAYLRAEDILLLNDSVVCRFSCWHWRVKLAASIIQI